MQSGITWIGYAAGALTTFAFLPQLLKTFRTKSVRDLHVGSLVAFDLGLVLWLLYGLYLHNWPMILANAVTLAIQLPLLALKLRYDGKQDARPQTSDVSKGSPV